MAVQRVYYLGIDYIIRQHTDSFNRPAGVETSSLPIILLFIVISLPGMKLL